MKQTVTVSPAYLKTKKGHLKPLIIPTRIYQSNKVTTMNYNLNDVKDNPVKLSKVQIKKGVIIDHPKDIRYNGLISFTSKKIKQFIYECFSNGSQIVNEEIKKKVRHSINTEFEVEFSTKLDNQKLIIDTEYHGKILIDKLVYDAFSNTTIPTEPEVMKDGEIDLNDWTKEEFEDMLIVEQINHDKEKERLINIRLSTEERYEKGHFDKSNIFELFASIKYNKELNETYNKIIIRLFEYRYYKNPKEDISNLNTQWVKDFFTFLWEEGYTQVNTKIFDPLKFDGSFLIGKNKAPYKPQAFHKLKEIFHTVSRKLFPLEIYHNIDFGKIDLNKICGVKKSKQGLHKNENLLKKEFDNLFFYNFEPNKLDEYQNIFVSFYEKSKLEITIRDLETARDIFCLQTMAGGLRGYNELVTLKFDKSGEQLSYYAEKSETPMQNPLNVYTEIIANYYNYQLPQFRFKLSHNSITNINRKLLKTIAEIIPLSREIISDKHHVEIKEIFTPRFSRKTFCQILYDEYDIHTDDIDIFTDHKKRNESEIVSSYIDTKSHIRKVKIFNKIELPKGKNLNTVRSYV